MTATHHPGRAPRHAATMKEYQMSVFILNVALAVLVTIVYVVPCVIQWRQHPAASGYTTLDRVAAVAAQAAILTAILAIVAAVAYGLTVAHGYTIIWN